MNENKLSELMKDAVADTPPPTFVHADIIEESARQRVRRRNGLLTGSAFGVAVLAGATALGVALWTGEGSSSGVASAGSVASPSNGSAAPYELPNEDAGTPTPTKRGEDRIFPPETPKQGGSSEGNGGPAGPTGTPSGCEQVDRELAAALAGELPAAASVKVDDAQPVWISCPKGSRGAMYNLSDGQIGVILVPVGESMIYDSTVGPKFASSEFHTSTGLTVVVVSVPSATGHPAPYAADLAGFAAAIARIF